MRKKMEENILRVRRICAAAAAFERELRVSDIAGIATWRLIIVYKYFFPFIMCIEMHIYPCLCVCMCTNVH